MTSPAAGTTKKRSGPDASEAGFWLYGLHLWTVFALALSNGLLAVCALASPWLARDRKIPWRRARAVLVPLGWYTALTLVSIAFSHDPGESLRAARSLFALATLPLGIAMLGRRDQVRFVISGLIIVSALLAVFGLGQLLFGYGDLHHRIRGPFSHYMTFAGVLLIADFLLLARMACEKRWRSLPAWAALLVINLALMASLTRSAWVAFALTFTVLLLLRAPRWILAYAPAALLFALLAPAPIVDRVVSIADLRDITNYDRLCMADAGLHMVRERPLFGIGPRMVSELYPLYRHPTAPRREVSHLHNSYFQIGAEQGLPALGAYIWLMLAGLVQSLRGYRSGDTAGSSDRGLYLGVFLALLAFSFAGLFEDNWGDTEIQRLVLFLLAAPYCLGSNSSSHGSPE